MSNQQDRKFEGYGQSGALLELSPAEFKSVDGNVGRVLRKRLPSPNPGVKNSGILNFPSRLALQAELQEKASKSDLFRHFHIPQVIATSPGGDFFDMELLDAITLGEAMASIKPSDLQHIGEVLGDYLLEHADSARVAKDDLRSIRQKIEGFYKTSADVNLFFGVASKDLTKLVLNALAPLSDGGASNIAFCGFGHGDFSLENILWEPANRRLGLVDFLDGPLRSRLADAGRLYLDLRFGWWRESNHASSPVASRQILSKVIFERFLELHDADGSHGLSAALRGSALLSVVRVLPYTTLPRRKALLHFAGRELVRELKELA